MQVLPVDWRRHLALRLPAAVLALLALALSCSASEGGENQLRLLQDMEEGFFPIGIWVEPPRHEATDERFEEMREAGINLLLTVFQFRTPAENRLVLELAEKHGFKVIVNDFRLYRDAEYFERVVDIVVHEYDEYEHLYGFILYDEPHASQFERLAKFVERINEANPALFGYINLFPTYAVPGQLGTRSYQEYVDTYMEVVKPQVLSYDHYPILAPELITNPDDITWDFYYNANVIRKAAAAAGVPYWTFLQSVGWSSRRVPTEDELRWQIYNWLAYGAKGFLYFTYWAPYTEPGFTAALIDHEGRRTALYYAAQRLNAEIKHLGATLVKLDVEDVYHANDPTGMFGAEPFRPTDRIRDVQGDPAVISTFSSKSGERYVMVVNRTFVRPASVQVFFDGVERLEEVSKTHFGTSPVLLDDEGSLKVELIPGEGRLYKLVERAKP